jgi:tetratricopeptide (TPR) repeat protein
MVAGVLTLSAAPALAQRKKKTAEEEERDRKMAEARALYDQGITHYNLGEFDLAIDKFKQAYALTNAPGLLFNIAQAYRLKGDYEQALYFYKTYIRLQPEAANRADVEARIAEMEKAIEDKKNQPVKPPVGTLPPDGGGGKEPGGSGKEPGGSGSGDGDGGNQPGGGDTTPPGAGTPPGGDQVAGVGGSGDGGNSGSAIGPGGDITTTFTPKSGQLGLELGADVDTATFKGAAFFVGGSYAVSPTLEIGGGLLASGSYGMKLGATLLFSTKALRPLARVVVPIFFTDTAVGVQAAAGVRYDLSPLVGVGIDLGVAYYVLAPDGFKTFYVVPTLAVQGRL